MRSRTWPMLVVLALLGLAACGRAPPPSAPAEPGAPAPGAAAVPATTRAAAIEAAIAGYEIVRGHWERGAERSTYAAYFENGRLRYLDETVAAPGAPARRNRYYYDNGVLFYIAGEVRASTVVGGGAGAVGPSVPVRAEFQGTKTLAAVRVEHYGEVKLAPGEVEALRRQAAELASAATAEEHAPKAP
jgi:hypothetical protein